MEVKKAWTSKLNVGVRNKKNNYEFVNDTLELVIFLHLQRRRGEVKKMNTCEFPRNKLWSVERLRWLDRVTGSTSPKRTCE